MKKFLIVVVIFLLVIFIGVMVLLRWSISNNNHIYEEYMKLGYESLVGVDYAQAEQNYLKAISIKPEKGEPYIQLAEVYIQQGKIEHGEKVLQDALSATNEDAVKEKLQSMEALKKHTDGLNNNLQRLKKEQGYLSGKEYTNGAFRTEEDAFSWKLKPYVLENGIFGTAIDDFDGDGQKELLVLLSKGGSACLQVYEWEEELILRDEEMIIQMDFPVVEEKYDFFYQKGKDGTRIFIEHWANATYFADGCSWRLSEFTYNEQITKENELAFGPSSEISKVSLDHAGTVLEDEKKVALGLQEYGFQINEVGEGVSIMEKDAALVKLASVRGIALEYDTLSALLTSGQTEVECVSIVVTDYAPKYK